jgi:hypothetical protein
VFLYRYPGTSYLATIVLSLRDKIHSLAEALLKLTLMGFNPGSGNRFLLPHGKYQGRIVRVPLVTEPKR